MESLSFTIISKNVYSLDLTIHSWIYRDIQPTPEKTSNTSFNRIISVNDKCVPIHVIQKNDKELTVFYPAQLKDMKEQIHRKVEWILGIDYDMREIYKTIKNDKHISHVYPQIIGAHPYTFDTFYEALIRAIIQQQISYRFANVVTQNLVLGLGPKIKLDDIEIHGFPNAQEIYDASDEILRSYKLGYKVNYIKSVTKEIIDGKFDIETVKSLNTQKAIKYMTKFKGIGKWTAEIALMSGLRRFDAFPYGDLGIRRTIGRIYYDGKIATRNEVIAISEQWHESIEVRNLVLYLLVSADVLGFL